MSDPTELLERKDDNKRVKPTSNIDLQLMTTDSEWGEPTINNEVKERLRTEEKKFYKAGTVVERKDGFVKFEQDTEVVSDSNYWSLLDIYTRDLRLGNISKKEGEFEYCQHMLDVAGDCLQEGYKGSFAIAMRKVASVLELSQSKGGFLRKLFNTLTYEQYTEEREPPKRGLFGKNKNDGRG